MSEEKTGLKLSEVLNNPNYKEAFKVVKKNVIFWKNDEGGLRVTSLNDDEFPGKKQTEHKFVYKGKEYSRPITAYVLEIDFDKVPTLSKLYDIKKIICDKHKYDYEFDGKEKIVLTEFVIKTSNNYTIELAKNIGDVGIWLDMKDLYEKVHIISTDPCTIIDVTGQHFDFSYEQKHLTDSKETLRQFPNLTEFWGLDDVNVELRGNKFKGNLDIQKNVTVNVETKDADIGYFPSWSQGSSLIAKSSDNLVFTFFEDPEYPSKVNFDKVEIRTKNLSGKIKCYGDLDIKAEKIKDADLSANDKMKIETKSFQGGSINAKNNLEVKVENEFQADVRFTNGTADFSSQSIGSTKAPSNLEFEYCKNLKIKMNQMHGSIKCDFVNFIHFDFENIVGNVRLEQVNKAYFNDCKLIEGSLYYNVKEMTGLKTSQYTGGLQVKGRIEYIGPQPLDKNALEHVRLKK